MNVSQIVEALPPLVYMRRGELVIQFANPGDLAGRVAELSSILSQLDQESGRGDGKGRAGKALGRVANGGSRSLAEAESGNSTDLFDSRQST